METGRPAKGGPELTRRAIDLIAPIGYGQRALIVAPARAGKTTLLHAITEGVAVNHPNAVLLILLVDERPEEVSEAISWGVGEVVSSSFDQPAQRHVEVTEMVLNRAHRLVESGKDVVIVLDSLTRMARAHNTAERGTGRTLSGGLDATAMAKPKAFFGSARSIPRHVGRRLADDHRHGARRNGLAHGRRDLRGVQGHGQLRDQARSQPGRKAHLSGDRHRHERHAPRGKAVPSRPDRQRLHAAPRAEPDAAAVGDGVADQAHRGDARTTTRCWPVCRQARTNTVDERARGERGERLPTPAISLRKRSRPCFRFGRHASPIRSRGRCCRQALRFGAPRADAATDQRGAPEVRKLVIDGVKARRCA